jgi:assimilatory nitrate reductase catalytic subunit
MALLAGRPGVAIMDRGATICSCFGIGANEIAAALARGCRTVDAIGEAIHAGTSCGSCRAEIRRIICEHQI